MNNSRRALHALQPTDTLWSPVSPAPAPPRSAPRVARLADPLDAPEPHGLSPAHRPTLTGLVPPLPSQTPTLVLEDAASSGPVERLGDTLCETWFDAAPSLEPAPQRRARPSTPTRGPVLDDFLVFGGGILAGFVAGFIGLLVALLLL